MDGLTVRLITLAKTVAALPMPPDVVLGTSIETAC